MSLNEQEISQGVDNVEGDPGDGDTTPGTPGSGDGGSDDTKGGDGK